MKEETRAENSSLAPSRNKLHIYIVYIPWLQTPTVLWLGGGIISPSYSTCMGLRMLGRQKYTQQNH